MKWLSLKVEISVFEMFVFALIVFCFSMWFWVPLGTTMKFSEGDLVFRKTINE